MGDDRVAAFDVVECAQVEIDRVCGPRRIGISASERRSERGKERAWRKEARERQRRASNARDDRRPTVEGDAVDETEMRNPICMSNGQRLRDAAANTVTNDARTLDVQFVEHLHHALGMRMNADVASEWSVASAVAKQIEHDESVAGGHERHDVAPQMARGGEAVDEHDGPTGATRSGRVVVQARARQIEKLTAHANPGVASGREDGAMCVVTPVTNATRAVIG